jgi:replicative DNA helicase
MIETIILENLMYNEEYLRKVLPFLKPEYFHDSGQELVFTTLASFIGKYNKPPTKSEVIVELKQLKGIRQATLERALDVVNEVSKKSTAPSIDWLVEKTETFCKDKALYNAIAEAATVLEKGSVAAGHLPDLLKDALSVSFDHNIGHDFVADAEARYKLLHETDEYRLKFDIDVFNEVTKGGLPKKTLSVFAAATGVGKSLVLCHLGARWFLGGYNVLYLTMEMAEEKISERIEANILNMNIDDVAQLAYPDYKRRFAKATDGCPGRLVVKEYPTAGAGVTQFRALLNELRLKKDFVPDVIIVDYINICVSSRFISGNVNSYQYVKAICEELRGLSKEADCPIVSATQLNREGTDNTDAGLKEISESSGLAMTVDLLWAIFRSEELDEQNMFLFKQLKSRFSDKASKLRFVVGVDRPKMRLYNATETPEMTKGGQVVSNGSPKPPQPSRPQNRKNKFANIKV